MYPIAIKLDIRRANAEKLVNAATYTETAVGASNNNDTGIGRSGHDDFVLREVEVVGDKVRWNRSQWVRAILIAIGDRLA